MGKGIRIHQIPILSNGKKQRGMNKMQTKISAVIRNKKLFGIGDLDKNLDQLVWENIISHYLEFEELASEFNLFIRNNKGLWKK